MFLIVPIFILFVTTSFIFVTNLLILRHDFVTIHKNKDRSLGDRSKIFQKVLDSQGVPNWATFFLPLKILKNGAEREKDLLGLAFATRDKQEGMEAFLARRPPRFQDF